MAKKLTKSDAKANTKAGAKGATKRAAKAGVKKGIGKPAVPASTGVSASVIDRLWTVVQERRTADPAISHSARLLQRGTPKVAQKFGEEAVECIIEAVAGDNAALVCESADVLYHLLVLWVSAGVHPSVGHCRKSEPPGDRAGCGNEKDTLIHRGGDVLSGQAGILTWR